MCGKCSPCLSTFHLQSLTIVISANRLYVQRGVVDEFTRRLVEKVSKLRTGVSLDSATTQGALVNQAALTKVQQHVDDALAKGARLEIGGKPGATGQGYFYQPTVMSNVTAEMVVSQEETFGPLAPIFPFDTEEEVVQQANSTEFGLAGYFFSKDVSRALRVAQRLQVGMVGINTGKISDAASPFGGVKESGYGREGSLHGMDEYTSIKTITIGNLNM